MDDDRLDDGLTTSDRVLGMLLGLAIGDALGRPTEGQLPAARVARNNGQDLVDFLPNRHAGGARAGTPSDDTQLAFRTVESLLELGRVDGEDLMRRFAAKRIFGMGATVRAAIEAYHAGTPALSCGQPSAGNGAMMRIAPLVLPYAQAPDTFDWDAAELATRITHDDEMAVAASFGTLELVLSAFAGTTPEGADWAELFLEGANRVEQTAVYTPRREALHFRGTLSEFIRSKVRPACRSVREKRLVDECNRFYSGAYLLETVPAVLLILAAHGEDPEQALIRAVNDTKDNDTVAAIVGAILGAHHGPRPFARWFPGLTGQLDGGDDGRVQELALHAAYQHRSVARQHRLLAEIQGEVDDRGRRTQLFGPAQQMAPLFVRGRTYPGPVLKDALGSTAGDVGLGFSSWANMDFVFAELGDESTEHSQLLNPRRLLWIAPQEMSEDSHRLRLAVDSEVYIFCRCNAGGDWTFVGVGRHGVCQPRPPVTVLWDLEDTQI